MVNTEEKIAGKCDVLFELKQLELTIYGDKYANLFWQTTNAKILPLTTLPWKFQMPFFLKFLHDDTLAERFKNLEILGAIDVYIKSKYFLNEELGLED